MDMDLLLFCGNLALTRRSAYPMRAKEDSGAPSFRIIESSKRAKQTINPIREFVQADPPRKLPEGRSLIKLSNGDPTTYGNLRPPKEVVAHLASTISEGVADGYSLSMGSIAARESIATWATETAAKSSTSKVSYSTKDCFLAAGASGALECALGTIADEGDNILVPAPGFPLFRTIAGGLITQILKKGLAARQQTPKSAELISVFGEQVTALKPGDTSWTPKSCGRSTLRQ
uniref:Aminotransferase class I/classII large domain-containing protein n=1 Tax=Rhodosorus marinus TaxID=101924 RepID=A0A7S3EIY7_9RHOD|mmetsp:Transcript_39804/g.158286  ORF Transcript_39804/g.158286 Transcript_39804/m.158286 type:complete len:232 (+) Transcript_39804:128-823(+)